MANARPCKPGAVAIIGMGCRLPGGANTPDELWQLLGDGADAVTDCPPGRLEIDELYDPDPGTPGKIYTRRGGFIEGIDAFDAGFFGIAPREARRIDPQQRLLLEVAWEALEDGGQAVHALAGSRTGVYVGISGHDYADVQVLARNRQRIDAHVNPGSAASIAANRISYAFDLRGPSLAIDTACSSSLTAVHLAIQSLRSNESELALALGVGALLAPEVSIGFCKASMLSPDGRCRAFDAGANGYVRSEGAGAVVLKPLERALADGDPIHAVILGTAINQDGRTTGMSVPSAAAQEAMIRAALRDAGVAPAEVGYVEAHGTGTAVGDPIEAEALGRVFAPGREAAAPCLIGSVKTNLGHMEAGAGIAGLIKAALVVAKGQIPPHPHFSEPNPGIPFDAWRLRVPTTLEPWPADNGRTVAGVNSFGFGGANAHVVIEGPPELMRGRRPREPRGAHEHRSADEQRGAHERSPQLLTVSARDPKALTEFARRHARRLAGNPAVSLRDYCYTAAVRRSHHPERLAVVGDSADELRERLDAFASGERRDGVVAGSARPGDEPKLAFVFPGMGPQWWGMGRRLLAEEPVFRREIEAIDRLLQPLAGWSLVEALEADERSSRVREAWLAHVANFALQVATAALWRSWGIVPDAVVGHSSGEMAAACVAGALSLQDAARLAYHRGRLQHRATGSGRMLAAAITPEEAERAIAGETDVVSLAAVNAPSSVTISGAADVLERIERSMAADGRFARFLPVDVPYHAPQMDPLRQEFLEATADLSPTAARVPLVLDVTGDWADGRLLDGDYWWRNIRETVRFGPAVERLVETGHGCFVEIGPHPVLAASIGEVGAEHGKSVTVLPSLRRGEDDRRVMLETFGALHVRGLPVDWSGVYPEGACVPLPAYPWQRERHWFDDGEDAAPAPRPASGVDTGHPLLGRRLASPRPTYETTLDGSRSEYLDEHVVQGSAVFPGAAYVEMLLAAAHDLSGASPIAVEDIEFRKLLFLNRPRTGVVQLHFDPRDGTAEIYSGLANGEHSWTVHTTGRVNAAAHGDDGRLDLRALRDACPNTMPPSEHYGMFERRGYHFGPSFRTLQEIRLGPDQALARISFPPDVDLAVDAYRVHPAMLDAALQLFGTVRVRSKAAPHDDAPFFPVSIRRLVHRRNPGRHFWAYVTVRHKDDPQRWNGDAWLIDESGEVCVALEQLRFKVLDEAAIGGEDRAPAGQGDDGALYELGWEAAALAAPGAGAPYPWRATADVRAAVETSDGPPERIPDVADYLERAEPELNRIATGFAAAALDSLGLHQTAGSGRNAQAPATVAPQHQRLIDALERMRVSADAPAPTIETLQHQLDELAVAHPQLSAEIELVRRGGRHLAEMLRGDLDAREVLLEGSSVDLLSRLYRASPTSRDFHALLARVVNAARGGASAERPLRVLEVGAGTGAAAEAVLAHLPASAEYVFTDISPYFLAKAREHPADHPGLRFAVLDIEQDPAEQGFAPGTFDLVLATNVLHATEDLRTSLGHARRLLAPGGTLLLLELTRKSAWFNLVFGLLPGWWRFSGDDGRADSPLLLPGEWRSLLEACGFAEATTFFQDEDEDDHLQTLVMARTPAAERREAVPARHWLVLADANGTAEQLAATLRSQGDRTTLVHPGDAFRRRDDGGFDLPPADADLAARLIDEVAVQPSAGEAGSVSGIVHCWSLDVPAAEALDAAALIDAQRYGCGSTLALVQALERRTGTAAHDLWLVTSGAQPVDGFDGAPNVAQSALWGLGRVLVSEQARIRCRMVDLGPEPAREEIAALAAELHGDGADEELALRGTTRLVRRLDRASLVRTARRAQVTLRSPETDAFRLELDRPGAIDSLLLREAPALAPGPGELLVRVVASGLIFLDVLQALGMLPPAAFQHDPDPDGLGTECAGIVLACGEGTEGFAPGDEVVSLAGAAHASRAIVRADFTTIKPPGLSFEDAASILNAFVTAEYALHHVGRVEPGERVLIHSASGAVGLAAIQHCHRLGAEVLATAGTSEKRAYLRSLGVEAVMDSRSLSWVDEVLERTGGEGVDAVLNSLGGEAIARGLGVLRPYGRFIELGKRDIYANTPLGLLPFQRNVSFHAVDLVQLMLHRPQLGNRLIRKVVREVAEGSLSPVPRTTFDLGEAERAFRLMAQAKHVGKIVLNVRGERYPVAARDDAPLCAPDATYLITGGLGGFGLAVADWLVREEGARTVVLMSRSGVPQDGDAATLEALRATAERVVVERGDVSCEDDVRRVLARIDRELPPLRGVIHAAMVLDDDPLLDLDQHRFRKVLEPKVAGAWNLHRLTRDAPLDLFVLFSSVASVIGHPLQGNYSAANAFLDALAWHRRALGLSAHTIGWGVMSEVGYVARHPEISQHLDRAGLVPMAPSEALATLGRLLRHDIPHVIAARMEWQKWAQLNSFAAASRRFASFVRPAEAVESQQTGGEGPLSGLRAAPAAERHALMETYLSGAIAKVLGTSAEKVERERPLTELGFDSLMAVELATAINSDLGVRLQVVKILEGTSTRQLAATLLATLDLDAAPAAGTAPPREAPPPGATAPAADDAAPHAATVAVHGDAPREAATPSAVRDTLEHARRPLSSEQRRFWFLEQLEPGDPAYHLYAAARVTGRLDVGVLRGCLDELLRRHDVLRSRFEAIGGDPARTVVPPMRAPLTEHDISQVDVGEREAALQRIATEEIRRPFDLSGAPLLRGVLVRLGEAEHALVLVVHHIAAEAWAVTLLVRELVTLYGELTSGRPSTRPEPSVSYDDYVKRQSETLGEQGARAQREYWERRLAGAPSELPLQTDRPRPAVPARTGRRHHFTLSSALSDELRTLARSEGTTLFTLLLAAFQTLLHRHSGATDLSIGTAVALRDQPGLEEVVGPCMNTLVLRTDLSGDPTFRDLLQRARETALGAFAHRDLPFERVVEALRPQRAAGRSPLFQAMLVMHDTRVPELRMEGLHIEPLEVDAEAPIADVTLFIENGEPLRAALEYDAELFDEATIVRLSDHFQRLLEGIVADPERSLSALPIASDEERRLVTTAWNGTAADDDGEARLHDLFDERAARSPDAIAVAIGDERVSYGALRARSGRLARYLKGAGVGPGVPVGVLLEPSLDAVIAALAIVKAGGVYLPLGPGYPRQRLRAVVEDARAHVLLTRGRPTEARSLGARVIDLDAERQAIDCLDADHLESGAGPDDPAYAIYTSGSTGAPKGVAIPHRAICNQLRWRQAAFALAPADAILLHTALGFDPSVWEIFGPLAAGARLVVPPPAAARDGARLVQLIADHDVSVVQVVPSLLEALLDEPGIGRCTSLRHVICGGEVLSLELCERFFARLPAELHNLYGPTEATIDATHWRCRPGDGRPCVPIGHPIHNVRVYVLDDRLQPTPIGAPGELCIGGAGVAPGYLNRPEESAQRFVRDPFDRAAGARLYRSGDRARWRADGTIEFLGRLDAQLKVRGFRVEPVEVEAALARHPDVRRAAVVMQRTASGDGRLVAFVEAAATRRDARHREATALDAAVLSDFLHDRLPPYMVPSVVVTLDELPRMEGGKVDRGALAAWDSAPSEPKPAPVAPRDEVEERLVRIWESLFPGQRIGVRDDFFELGGHSLLAMRLAARIRSEFDDDMPVTTVLRGRTIEALGQRLREHRAPGPPAPTSPLVALHEGGTRWPFFCVHAVGGSAFPYVALAQALGDGRPFYALEARGLDGNGPPRDRIEVMAAEYVQAVRSVQPEGPYLLGGWSMGGMIAFEMARFLEADGANVALLALLDTGRTLADPHAWDGDPAAGGGAQEQGLLQAFARSLGLAPEGLLPSLEGFERLEREEQLAFVLEQGQRAGLLPPGMDAADLRRHLDVFAANLAARRDYVPRTYSGRVTLLESAEPPKAGDAAGGLAWEALALGGLERGVVPGDHYSMLREPRVRQLARSLAERLDAAESLAV